MRQYFLRFGLMGLAILAACANISDQDFVRHDRILLQELKMGREQFENKTMDRKQYHQHLERLRNREKILFYEVEKRQFTDAEAKAYFAGGRMQAPSVIQKELDRTPAK